MSEEVNDNGIDYSIMKRDIDYVQKKGYTVSRGMPGQCIIDHNSFVISNEQVPKHLFGKIISVPMFSWDELITKKDNTKEIIATEQNFRSFCITNRIKYKSKTYYKYQMIYFNGAISILGEVPPKWGISIMSSREIIEAYTL